MFVLQVTSSVYEQELVGVQQQTADVSEAVFARVLGQITQLGLGGRAAKDEANGSIDLRVERRKWFVEK